MQRNQSGAVLLVRVPSAVCALPISEVVETMRPLPVSPLSEAPDFVGGIAIIRGVPTPVVELGALFQAGERPLAGRFITVRSGGHTIALAVQSVIGVAELDRLDVSSLPPLMANARTDVIEAIGRLDAELLVMLQTVRLVPESIWETLGKCEAAR
jgi:purine-binding chemotaxis protein CheW